jgi:hypothetical protein
MDDINKYFLTFLMPLEHFTNVTNNISQKGEDEFSFNAILFDENSVVLKCISNVKYNSTLIDIISSSDARKNNFHHHFFIKSANFELELSFSIIKEEIISINIENKSGLLETIFDIEIILENVFDPETNIKYQKFVISFHCKERIK